MTDLQQNYIRENHRDMTVKQMQAVLRIDPTKIYKFMGENGLEVKRLKPGKKLRVWTSGFFDFNNTHPITGHPLDEKIDLRTRLVAPIKTYRLTRDRVQIYAA